LTMKQPQKSRSYSIRFFYISIGLVAFMVAFNLVVDPLDIYRLVDRQGFNEIKPKISRYSRIAKPIQTERFQPQSLAFGSSRTEYGMNMSHPVWKSAGLPAFNNAVSAATIYDVSRLFQHAVATAPVKTAVIGLDLFMFNAYLREFRAIEQEELLAVTADGKAQTLHKVDQLLITLLSKDIFSASLSTLRKQKEKERKFTREGQRINSWQIKNKILPKGGFYKVFRNDTRGLATEMWSNCRDNHFAYEGNGENSFAIFRNMLELAGEEGIELKLFISPSHAWLQEALYAMNLWDEFEQWKRDLVQEVSIANSREKRNYIALWDFSGYTKYTTEKVPVEGDAETVMAWFIDPSHYADNLGNLLLDKMFGEEEALEGLGVRLEAENIDQHLSATRQLQDQYRENNPETVIWVQEMANEVLELKRETGMACG